MNWIKALNGNYINVAHVQEIGLDYSNIASGKKRIVAWLHNASSPIPIMENLDQREAEKILTDMVRYYEEKDNTCLPS